MRLFRFYFVIALSCVSNINRAESVVDIVPDFSQIAGPVKPVNGVGQPPMVGAPIRYPMMHYLKEAGIPYSRLHDVGGPYGRMTFVDIPNLFRDFDADENDPANYDFAYTDILLKALEDNGIEPFFRLGVSIEHFAANRRYRIDPPKDFGKWARIAEHVIRHYTEGWADGFHTKIAYWEIWNEPDNFPDPEENCMWHGSWNSYLQFYGTVACHLKAKFPHLKIGGYGSCGFYSAVGSAHVKAANSSSRMDYFVSCFTNFLDTARNKSWPLDFFSFHSYSMPDEARLQVAYARRQLDSFGFTQTETCFNEWLPQPCKENRGTALQAAQVARELADLQNGPCDMAMIYDARCSGGDYSPLFNPLTESPHKAYYAFVAFNELRKLGYGVRMTVIRGKSVSAVGATDGQGNSAVLVANDGDAEQAFVLRNIRPTSCLLTDATHTYETVALPAVLPPHSFLLVRGQSCEDVRIFDLGPQGEGGYPAVELENASRGTVVRMSYATHPDGLRDTGDFFHETRADYLGKDVWLPILPASTDRYDEFSVEKDGVWVAPLAQGLVRYVKVVVKRGRAKVDRVWMENRGVHSQERILGSFTCSDDRVNDVWRASVRTCQLAAIPGRNAPLRVAGARTNALLGISHPYLSDGAKRDRLVWSGDLWWAQRNMYVAFDARSPYMPGSIRMLGENQCPNGYVQACPYPESHGPVADGEWGPFGSDEFAAWFVPVVWDHYLYTADEETAREAFPRVVRLMAYLQSHQGEDCIFEPRRETCKNAAGLVFGATSLYHRSYMDILLWKAYDDAARLADVFGTAEQASSWRSMACRIASAIRTAYWDAKAGWYVHARENHVYAPEANALALAVRFATNDEADMIVRSLRHHEHGKFQALAARGAFEYGFAEEAMRLIASHGWYAAVSPEWAGLHTTYECMKLTTDMWGDEAHPDTAIAGLFTNYLLGVQPVEPGFRSFRVSPSVPRGMTHAEGVVPTPRGLLRVSWTRGPQGIACQVIPPAGTRQVE